MTGSDTENEAPDLPADEAIFEKPIRDYTILSKPTTTEGSTVPMDILTFNYSYGYNCKKLFNLVIFEPDFLCFGSGNYIHFFDLGKQEMTFRRTSLGGGIGFITKNPNPEYNYLTVAENGDFPPVIIYKFPEMEIISVCEGGSRHGFSYVAYNVDGELMASQGCDPDYMITVWDWKNAKVILRSKSFFNDVLKVMFSPYNEGQLTTGGLGHIKFWKMASTFTGLKLHGEIGRFGKTEICDIIGIYPMPDEQVISGCDWGNILVWDAGLIKFEVCRKNRLSCHEKAITLIQLHDGEVMTAGRDGHVRIWFWETVELADPPDDDRFVEIEPVYEYRIGSKNHLSEIISMVKLNPHEPENFWWYVQDGNGGIWMADISPEPTPAAPMMLFRCHAGPIMRCASSPFSTHFVTLGRDSRLHVYDYQTKNLIYYHQFPAQGCDLIWLPLVVDPSGIALIIGNSDGVIRLVLLHCLIAEENFDEPLVLRQALKPHTAAITVMSTNPRFTILATGAADHTIFINQLVRQFPYVNLEPIGFVTVHSIPTAINWKPVVFSTIIVGCLDGEILEADMPERPKSYTDTSYKLGHVRWNSTKFVSKKGEIRRELKLQEIEARKEAKKAKKKLTLDRLRKDNPGIQIDEETFFADSESEEELEPIYIPPVPNKILWMMYTDEHTIWLSMGGYDAGYIYEYGFAEDESPYRCTLIKDGDDIEINSYLILEHFIIFGMRNGSLRVNRIQDDFRDLSDYWIFPLHDNYNGVINCIEISYDMKYIFTVGEDGNIFCLETHPIHIPPTSFAQRIKSDILISVPDIEDERALSLEEAKQRSFFDKKLALATEKKNKVLDVVSNYNNEFRNIFKKNQSLLPSQLLTDEEMELDERITEDLDRSLTEQMSLVERILSFDVEKSKIGLQKMLKFFIDPQETWPFTMLGIMTKNYVSIFRIRSLSTSYFDCHTDLEERIKTEQDRKRVIEIIEDTGPEEKQMKVKKLESFLQGVSTSTIENKLDVQMRRLLKKYRERKAMEEDRREEWESHYALEPDPRVNHSNDDKAIKQAKATIGDYKMKIDPMFIPPEEDKDTTFSKYKELLHVREEIFNIRNNFNKKVIALREKKEQLIEFFREKLELLEAIHQEIPEQYRKYPIAIPQLNIPVEFPEKLLEFQPNYDGNKPKKSTKSFITTSQVQKEQIEDEIWSIILNMEALSQTHDLQALGDNADRAIASDKMFTEYLNYTDSTITPWEREAQVKRRTLKLYEQDILLDTLQTRIESYDKNLFKLMIERINVEVEAKFLDQYLLTVNQEVWALKDFERLEHNLIEKVDEQLIARNTVQQQIINLRNKIENVRKDIEKLNSDEKIIHNQFLANCTDNKFADFLRRIFRKKYRPPKIIDPDVSESSSSSSESSTDEEEDAASIDSSDIGPIRMDENVCPTGCDRGLYDLTFELRDNRHKIEQSVREKLNAIEEDRRQVDSFTREIKQIEIILQQNRDELQDFRREKQKILNKITSLVVVKMEQMQYFTNKEELKDTTKALLFDTGNVTKLYTRVSELQLETIWARRQHRMNVVHLARMKTDIKYMQKYINQLKFETKDTVVRKFGFEVDLNELEESILRKSVFKIRANVDEAKKEMDKETRKLKKTFADKQQQLECLTQESIEKLNILTVLQEEHNNLNHILFNQSFAHNKQKSKHLDYTLDLSVLREISKKQNEKIIELERSICTLRLKAKPISPIIIQEFREVQPEPPPGFGEKAYEELIARTCAPLSARKSFRKAPNVKTISDITKLVEKFLLKNLGNRLDYTDLKRRAFEISRYFTHTTETFDTKQTEEILKCAAENFNRFIPKDLLHLITIKDVSALFENIIRLYVFDEQDVNPKELMESIIDDAKDTVDPDVLNYTQHMLTYILKELVIVMPYNELADDDTIYLLAEYLLDVPKIIGECIDIMPMANELVVHANDNLVDDLSLATTIELLTKIREQLKNFVARQSTVQEEVD